MKATKSPRVRIVLYEGLGADPLDGDSRYRIMRALLERGLTVTCTGPQPADDMTPGTLASVEESVLLVIGRFEGGQPPQVEDAAGRVTLHLLHLTDTDDQAVVQQIDQTLGELDVAVNQPGQWKPWFPVIDYSRCTNCMQCLSFCLFGVYGVDADNKIQVQNNDNCKTDCPACSRVCPEVAIMFPKYSQGPINGDQIREDDLKREAMKVDISSLLGGDIYAQLKQRSSAAKERFAKERDEKRALSERIRCLNKLAGQMDIPKEVLLNLPSQDEIRQRAADAAAKGRAALEAGD
ncbi:ferredoxin family protein [Planctomycetales bacterium ZRK34]|nr:ferredoxin family protein [Planctomycetales bacterium ZRK34]